MRMESGGVIIVTHCDIPRGSYSQTFDTNICAFVLPGIHISEATGGERFEINGKKVGRNHMGCWKCSVSCTYVSEFAQTLSGSGSQRIETVESLLTRLSLK